MRVIVANIAAASENEEDGRFMREVLGPLTVKSLALGAPDGTHFTMRWSEEGERHPAFASCRYIPRLAPHHIFGALETAGEEGFDGAIVGCFGDPSLAECRARLSIPVVGFGESALLEAAATDRRIGLVTPAEILLEPTRQQAIALGIDPARLEIIVNRETPEQQENGLLNAGHTIAAFLEDARTLIRRGARILVPACGLQPPALRFAPGVEEKYGQGIREVDGVPVVDVLAAAARRVTAAAAARRTAAETPPRRPMPTKPRAPYWDS